MIVARCKHLQPTQMNQERQEVKEAPYKGAEHMMIRWTQSVKQGLD